MLKVGDTAPDFSMRSQTGEVVRLADYRGRQNVVLYFYPKDNTPVCTRETCAFRDGYEEFASKETAVIGVSGDTPQSHAAFAARHKVPFPLLSDEDGALRRAYGVTKPFGIVPGRVTFVIDKQGLVRDVCTALFQADKHVQTALRAIASDEHSIG